MTQGEALYIEGRLKEAAPVLAREAAKGDGRAMYCLGQIELYGLMTGRERTTEAAVWFRKGEADPLACLMALPFLRKDAVDEEKAREALAAAKAEAASGGVNALFCLAVVHWTGGVPGMSPDTEEGDRYGRAAMDAGFWLAELQLGLHALNGTYREKNEEVGAALLRRAADKGIARAQYHLAYCCLTGVGTAEQPSLGAAWYRKAAAQGYHRAAVELGVFCEQGFHVKKDLKKAFQLYKKAAEGGDPDGMAHLADAYRDGVVTARNVRKAADLYRRAVNGGSAYALLRLGEVAFSQGDRSQAYPYFLEAAKSGLVPAQYLVGMCLLYGIGTEQDRAAATVWLRRAAQKGSVEAQRLIAQDGLL